MTKQLVIFDLDGTLLDTIEDLANAVNFALKNHNLPTHPTESFRFFVGNGVTRLLERSVSDAKRTDELVASLKKDFIKHYFAHSEECTRPYPGISELVNSLYAKGFTLAVASNKIHQATVDLVKKFFPEVTFRAIRGQREGFPIKPDPLIVEEIMDVCGVDRKHTIYVGDSGVDAQTAQRAGVDFCAVKWGFRPEEELREAGAEVFISTPDELFKLI